MEREQLNRELVGEFFEAEDGTIRLNALTVFQDERTHRSKHIYDVDYSKEYGYIFHMSGGGGGRGQVIEVSGLYFVVGKLKVIEKEAQWVDSQDRPPWVGEKTLAIRKRNATRRLTELPLMFVGAEDGDLLAWLENSAIESESVWCSICDDCFPGENNCDLCVHCWWCDKTGWWSTPSERCACKDREECEDLEVNIPRPRELST